ncbi:MAG: chromate resistance protein ChrB domain-containing protein [Actinomycetota bacterium]
MDEGETMRWITRERPKTDRIACPWLIRRFIDPQAEVVFLPAASVVDTARADPDARSFDAPGADYTHRANRCTFEVLIHEFSLGSDPALERLARIVHAADISEELETDPLGAGLLAIGEGGLDVEDDDHRLLERSSFVYDALYAWCRRRVASDHGAP